MFIDEIEICVSKKNDEKLEALFVFVSFCTETLWDLYYIELQLIVIIHLP